MHGGGKGWSDSLNHPDSKWKPIRWKKPYEDHVETAALPRKHGGKTGDELKAEGK
jgi:hypothetical protein